MISNKILATRYIVYAIVAGVLFVGCAKSKVPTVSGTLKGIESGTIYLQHFDEKIFVNIDSAEIKNGKFAFSTELTLPEVYGLSVDTTKGSYLIFLDNNSTEVELDSASSYSNTVVRGSVLQDEFLAYKKLKDVKIDEYIKAHPNSLVSAYILYRDFVYRLNASEIEANIALLSPELQKTTYIETLKKVIEIYGIVTEGKSAPDFSAQTPNGETVSLKDRLGKGYLLIDFWASWCPGCRKENPNLLKTYEKYKQQGFDILGVSLDKEGDLWKQAIDKDKLTWTNISDLKFWHSEPARLYGVRVIPSNFLVDKNGIILAKNLKGEELDKYLEGLFAKK